MKHGFGVYNYARTGEKYEGEWKNDMWDGKGTYCVGIPQRSSSRETGKEGCSTARLRLFTKTKIDLSEFLKTEGKMEEAKLFMEMDHILKENSKMISQQVEEKCPIELREE